MVVTTTLLAGAAQTRIRDGDPHQSPASHPSVNFFPTRVARRCIWGTTLVVSSLRYPSTTFWSLATQAKSSALVCAPHVMSRLCLLMRAIASKSRFVFLTSCCPRDSVIFESVGAVCLHNTSICDVALVLVASAIGTCVVNFPRVFKDRGDSFGHLYHLRRTGFGILRGAHSLSSSNCRPTPKLEESGCGECQSFTLVSAPFFLRLGLCLLDGLGQKIH